MTHTTIALQTVLEALKPLSVSAELRGDNLPEGNEVHKMADAGFKAIAAVKQAPAPPVQEPVARLKGVDEYGPMLEWYKHWATLPIGTKFYINPPTTKPTLRVRGWVWKNERCDGLYVPSYTPAQHVQRGELWALVDPQDLHQPLENTGWFAK